MWGALRCAPWCPLITRDLCLVSKSELHGSFECRQVQDKYTTGGFLHFESQFFWSPRLTQDRCNHTVVWMCGILCGANGNDQESVLKSD